MKEKIIFFIEDFFWPFLTDLGKLLYPIILIITGMLVALEILKVLKVLDFLNKILYYLLKPLGISKNASMPLLIGILAGITYGAGAILASYANKEMNKKDVILVSIFLSICHAVIEDTLLFASIHAKGWVLLVIRIPLAVIVTMVLGRLIHPKEDPATPLAKEE